MALRTSLIRIRLNLVASVAARILIVVGGRPTSRVRWGLLGLVLLGHCAAFAVGQTIDFARDVRPILQRHCYACHGPRQQDSGLRLDLRARTMAGGDLFGTEILVAGNAIESRLIQFVSRDDAELRMPPEGDRLTAEEIATLASWVQQGANWPDSLAGELEPTRPPWSLNPLAEPELPAGTGHPIDRFIRQKLAAVNLQPAPNADRRALVRRLSYDLTGLPPTPDEVDAFVADSDPAAVEKLVERLLESPRYGEHWARHWLDLANYADTHGNDHDYARPNAWPYRDYVIAAFNADKPYDRFIQEQVAGDRLFPDDPQATVALGFVAAGPWDHTLMVTVREDTVDHLLSQYLDRDGMVSTVIGTFQSLTIHCARCHDHKFDPISQREYYALQAVFAGVDRADRPYDLDPATHQQRARLLAEQKAIRIRDPAWLPVVDSSELAERVAAWESRRRQQAAAWSPLEIQSVVSTGNATLKRLDDSSWLVAGNRPERETYVVAARQPAGELRAVRLEVLPDESLPQHGPGRWDNGNFHLSEFRLFAASTAEHGAAVPLALRRATADFDEGPAISAAQTIDRKSETHWGIHPRYGEPHEIVFELETPLAADPGGWLTILLEHQANAPGHGIGRFRLSGTCEPFDSAVARPVPEVVAASLNSPAASRTTAEQRELVWYVLQLENEQALATLPPPKRVYAIANDFPPDGENFKSAEQPRPIHLLQRGELSRPGERIGPGTLACIPGLAAEFELPDPLDEGARRAALARWLSSPENVLTWRSIVNRVWAWHFGRGLVETPSDFGAMGAAPSHPELLDWLAIWFRDEAHGSLKSLHRLILSSAAWQQATQGGVGNDVDADNRWLWRQNRRRLTAEEFRDTLLALSGQLDQTMGGPAAIQFIERGDATFMPGGNPAFLDYEHFSPDAPAARRRAIYRFVFRTVPDPLLDALDCPDGCAATPSRSVSATAAQALALLNDPFVIRQCEHIAARLQQTAGDAKAQATALVRTVYLRDPTAAEQARLTESIERHGLANACQVLVNSSEFLFLD